MFEKSNPIKKLGIKVGTKNYQLVRTPTLQHEVKSPRDFIDGLKMTFHRFKSLKRHRPDVFVQFDIALGLPRWRRVKKYTVGYDLIPLLMRNEYLPAPMQALTFNGRVSYLKLLLGVFALPLRPRKARHYAGVMVNKVRKYLRNSYHLNRYKRNLKLYRKVDGILCISQATKKSFQELLHIKPSRLFDLPLAAVLPDERPSSKAVDAVKQPYIFYIGGTDDRKRVQDVVYAYNIARGRGLDMQLVLAGNEFKKVHHIPNLVVRHAILSSPYRDDILLAGFVNDAEKLGLYQNALAFIFSSSYEGFGLPVLEAAEMSCPVIAYNNSSIAEIASNDSAILCETGNFVEIAQSIQRLVAEKDLAKNITDKAKRRSLAYTWKATTKQLLSVVLS